MSRLFLLSVASAAVLGLAAFTALGPAFAHAGTNHGTIKVHEDAEVDPEKRNQPHVECEFWVEGFNMAGDAGHITIFAWAPTGDKGEVLSQDWTADGPDGTGFHFLVGPITLDEGGHYRVEAYLDQGHPGNTAHFAKSKVFWVEPCNGGGGGQGVPCPPGVIVTAVEDTTITVAWTAVADADSYNVYRAVGAGEFDLLATTAALSIVDTDTTVGETYTYVVRAVVDGVESEGPCGENEVTAIPFFPTEAGFAMAGLGSLGIYALVRRRG